MTVLHIFSTPISNTVWADAAPLNAALAAHIRAQATAGDGLRRSNVGGWHSKADLLESEAECIKIWHQRARDYVHAIGQSVATDSKRAPTFRLEAWSNLVRRGDYHSPHSHPNAAWSGVYYVNGNPAPDYAAHPMSGKLELQDPRPGASLSYAEGTNLYGRFLVNPQPGQLIVFPGWLTHQVHPYFGNEERITIAFNAIQE